MASTLEHLRSHVFGASAKRMRKVVLHHLGKTKISKSDVPFVVENDILWFEISVDHTSVMQCLYC